MCIGSAGLHTITHSNLVLIFLWKLAKSVTDLKFMLMVLFPSRKWKQNKWLDKKTKQNNNKKQLQKTVTCQNLTQMVSPRDISGKAEEEENQWCSEQLWEPLQVEV